MITWKENEGEKEENEGRNKEDNEDDGARVKGNSGQIIREEQMREENYVVMGKNDFWEKREEDTGKSQKGNEGKQKEMRDVVRKGIEGVEEEIGEVGQEDNMWIDGSNDHRMERQVRGKNQEACWKLKRVDKMELGKRIRKENRKGI